MRNVALLCMRVWVCCVCMHMPICLRVLVCVYVHACTLDFVYVHVHLRVCVACVHVCV